MSEITPVAAGVYEVPSRSKPGQFHTVRVSAAGLVECDCPGYRWRGRCSHVEAVRARAEIVAPSIETPTPEPPVAPKARPVYLMSYAARRLPELRQIAEGLDATVVDLRYSASSRDPQWRQPLMRAALGRHYAHVIEFGNQAYKTDGVKLVDYEGGRAKLDALSGDCVVLLCGCRNHRTCHRAQVAEMLRQDGYTVQEIDD